MRYYVKSNVAPDTAGWEDSSSEWTSSAPQPQSTGAEGERGELRQELHTLGNGWVQ